jgi:hypothetical protein
MQRHVAKGFDWSGRTRKGDAEAAHGKDDTVGLAG